jgi:predicted metal-dependent phosphoesterase TrpH
LQLIDLHLHSTSSDGIFTPTQLVKIAHDAGLTVIAIADHDSVEGVGEAIESAKCFGIMVIPAVELSVAYGKYQDVHLLGYWIDHNDIIFRNKLLFFRQQREKRGFAVIDRINIKLMSEGRDCISNEEVLALADGALGRPHIARALINNGFADSMQEAFVNYLNPCNVPKEYLPFPEALSEIKRTGGIAVLAHPQSIVRNRIELTSIISDMTRMGLDGIEAFNTMGFDDDERFMQKLAASLGIIITGGSDFHGDETGLSIGRGKGNLYLTSELLIGLNKLRRMKLQ